MTKNKKIELLRAELLHDKTCYYGGHRCSRHRIHGREKLQALADTFTKKQERCIADVMAFETSLLNGFR